MKTGPPQGPLCIADWIIQTERLGPAERSSPGLIAQKSPHWEDFAAEAADDQSLARST